jgi:hypothetical protein
VQQLQLVTPMRFRFTEEADAATYGGDWWTWDETELSRLPARELIALEEAVGMPVVVVLQGLRQESTRAKLAAMWIAMHRAGHKVAWAEFNPAALLASWEEVPPETPLDSGEAPEPGSGSSSPPSAESPIS